jgi:hypothetical protein
MDFENVYLDAPEILNSNEMEQPNSMSSIEVGGQGLTNTINKDNDVLPTESNLN